MLTKQKHSIEVRVLSVRLSEPELRRFKTIAASRGVTVQKAVQEALDLWEAQAVPSNTPKEETLRGSLAGTGVLDKRREEKVVELAKDRRWL